MVQGTGTNNIGQDQYTIPLNFNNGPVPRCAQLMLWSSFQWVLNCYNFFIRKFSHVKNSVFKMHNPLFPLLYYTILDQLTNCLGLYFQLLAGYHNWIIAIIFNNHRQCEIQYSLKKGIIIYIHDDHLGFIMEKILKVLMS